MPSLADALADCRRRLAESVQKEIRGFQQETGFAVSGFDIQHHYTGMTLDPDESIVLSVNIKIKEKE